MGLGHTAILLYRSFAFAITKNSSKPGRLSDPWRKKPGCKHTSRWVESNFVDEFKTTFALGTKIVLFGGLRFLSSMGLRDRYRLKQYIMFYIITQVILAF